jgi:hypothetical protein
MKFSVAFAIITGIGLLLSAGVRQARAWPPEVGPELEFTNSDITRAWERQANPDMILNGTISGYQIKFKDRVVALCPDCVITQVSDKYGQNVFRVTLEGGWYFNITMDPGVIEITSKPIPASDLSDDAKRETMQKLIWGAAAQLDLHPDTAGHLNFGIESTFGEDALLFRNFFVDYLNHVGLVGGAAGYRDDGNAPHPELLPVSQRQALKSIFADFDPKTQTIQDLAKSIYTKVYFKSYKFGGSDGEPAEKYQAVNISSLVNMDHGPGWPRIELRSTTMENSAHELELLTKLYVARIEYLKKIKTPIQYTADTRFNNGKYAGRKELLVKDFHDYVVESGLDWNDYRTFTQRNADLEGALERFEAQLAKQPKAVDRLRDAMSEDCKT